MSLKIVDGSGNPFPDRQPEPTPPDPATWWERFAAAKRGWNDSMRVAAMPATRIERVGDFDEPIRLLLEFFEATRGIDLDLPMELDKVPDDAVPGIQTCALLTLLSDAWNGVMQLRGFPPSEEAVAMIDQQLGIVTRVAWVLSAGVRIREAPSPSAGA